MARPTDRAPRADAVRNAAAILEAAQTCLAEDPHATMSRIAEAAGVGRVTLYGHFATRAELVDAVFRNVSERSVELLHDVDTAGDPVDALVRIVRASWRVVHRYRGLLAAAETELPPERIRSQHDPHLTRMTELIHRGQASGDFRSDLTADWLVTVTYSVMHAAAREFSTGNMALEEGERAVVATVVAAVTPTGSGGSVRV
ncbi:TetR/AcrR family transcriptional regulator [Cellulomonas sp. URHE0023]|uniref:TetR/AcrR family transcriptional regulator n=1 Tax=Cellulomonas sp. URHE0023 TaxID=1380354 RepID=UPI0005541821|nr:TetR/AcrR family transcriptional regulator [Cellulomonas sp. URHE0023]